MTGHRPLEVVGGDNTLWCDDGVCHVPDDPD